MDTVATILKSYVDMNGNSQPNNTCKTCNIEDWLILVLPYSNIPNIAKYMFYELVFLPRLALTFKICLILAFVGHFATEILKSIKRLKVKNPISVVTYFNSNNDVFL